MSVTQISSDTIDPNELVTVSRKDLMTLLEINIPWNTLYPGFFMSVVRLRKDVGLPKFPERYLYARQEKFESKTYE